MNYFSIVLEQVEVFVVYLLIGIIAVKTNVLNREKLGALSSCVTKILLPLLIFSNSINGATKEQFLSSTVILLLTAVYYLVLYLVTAALSKLLHLDIQHRNLYRACSMFGNCGFMGIPIILALYPEQGGIYIAVFTVIDQLVLWTIGLDLTSPPESQTSVSLSKRLIKMINQDPELLKMQVDLRDSSHKNDPAAHCFLYNNALHSVHRPQHRRHSQRPLRPPIHGLHCHDRRDPALRRRLRCRHDLHNDPVFDCHAASCVPESVTPKGLPH